MSATETKYCKHCGEKIHEDAVVCPECGRQVELLESSGAAPTIIVNNNNNNTNNNSNNTNNTNTVTATVAATSVTDTPHGIPVRHSMAWFRFLRYFCLLAYGILFVITAGMYFAMDYGLTDFLEWYTPYCTELQIANIAYGVFHILLAIMAFIARSQLTHFSKHTLKWLTVGSFLYFFGFSAYHAFGVYIMNTVDTSKLPLEALELIINEPASELASVSVTFGVLILLFAVLNIPYFKRRSYLFVN